MASAWEQLVNHSTPTPLFFASVDSKGLRESRKLEDGKWQASGNARGARAERRGDGEAGDRGRRSFLRGVEGQPKYNA